LEIAACRLLVEHNLAPHLMMSTQLEFDSQERVFWQRKGRCQRQL